MAPFSDPTRFERNGLDISGQGLQFDVEWGVAGTARSDGAGVDGWR